MTSNNDKSALANKREPWTPLLCHYPDSRKVNAVSIGAETLFTRLLAQCDDDANFDGEPMLLLMKLFAYRFRNGQVNLPEVARWREELLAVGLVVLYRPGPDEPELLHIVNCKKHLRGDIRPDIRFPAYSPQKTVDITGRQALATPDRVMELPHTVVENNGAPCNLTSLDRVGMVGRTVPAETLDPCNTTTPDRGDVPSRTGEGETLVPCKPEFPDHAASGCRTTEEENDVSSTTTTATTTTTPTEYLCTERKASVPCRSTIEYDFSARQFLHITDADRAVWARAYPAVNLDAELCRAGEWLLANPRQRKKNIRRFLGNWLSRCQERGGSRTFNRSPPPAPSPLRSPCRVCGAKASKFIDGQGAFCPLHGPWDLETNPQPTGTKP